MVNTNRFGTLLALGLARLPLKTGGEASPGAGDTPTPASDSSGGLY